MKIHIESLSFYAIIGLLEFERLQAQRVIIDVEMEYDYVDDFIDYAKVIKLIEATMINNRYFLLETAIEELKNILFERCNITFLKLKISKPDIIANAVVSLSNEYKSDKKNKKKKQKEYIINFR